MYVSPSRYAATLSMHELRLMVHLGVGKEERAVRQPVLISLTFYLSALPKGCRQDGKGYLCYDGLATFLRQVVEQREFALIEYLALECADAVQQWLNRESIQAGLTQTAFTLVLHKPLPPVEGLEKGVSFTYTTLPQGLAAINV